MLKKFSFAVLAALAAAPFANAAPLVTMTQVKGVGGTANTAYDFYYQAGAGAEFTAYDFAAVITNAGGGVGILDPIRGGGGGQSDEGGDAIDTFANTVGSLLGAGAASYQFTTYNPAGFSPTPLPAAAMNWTVFDTLEGDTDAAGPSPYKLVRLLTTADARGTATFSAFNNQSGSTPTVFNFQLGIPEPATMALAGMGLMGLVAIGRRRA